MGYIRVKDPPPGRCKKRIYDTYGGRWCPRKAVKDGWCKQHHPDAQKARDAKREAYWKARAEQWERDDALHEARNAVFDAALELKVFTDGPEAHALQKAVKRYKLLAGGQPPEADAEEQSEAEAGS